MELLKIESKFFNPKDTLECGQVFRYKPFLDGYLVFSVDKCCYLYEKGGYTYIESEDVNYFENYFDLTTDYQEIYDKVKSYNVEFLTNALEYGKGIRILKQDLVETAFSFIISQNNNIKRIQSSIEKLCVALGDKKSFIGETYYTFPKIEKMVEKDKAFFRELGFGYRDAYILEFAKSLYKGLDLNSFKSLDTKSLEKKLVSIYGIGKKVADCILLFAYNRSDAFPVDTWIEKFYVENLGGKERDRAKMSLDLQCRFGDLSGYVQQYVFYFKRSSV